MAAPILQPEGPLMASSYQHPSCSLEVPHKAPQAAALREGLSPTSYSTARLPTHGSPALGSGGGVLTPMWGHHGTQPQTEQTARSMNNKSSDQ